MIVVQKNTVTSTEERQKAFSEELKGLLEWERIEGEKVLTRLKSEGKVLGLDSYPEEFAYIREKRNQCWKEILEKYKDLPPDTKLKLW